MERNLVEGVRIVEGCVLRIEPFQRVGVDGLVNLLFCLCHYDDRIA